MKNSKKIINFEEIEQKYDPQLSFRKLGSKINIIIIKSLNILKQGIKTAVET